MDSLDGYSLLSQPVLGLVHDSKSSLTNFFLEEVFIFDIAVSSLQK
jgi:hypothetical protein